jgi:hypothetical protein
VSRRCCSSHCNQSSSASLHSCCTVDSLRPASTAGFSASWFPAFAGTLAKTCDVTVFTPVVAPNLYRLAPPRGNIGFEFLNIAFAANRRCSVIGCVSLWDVVSPCDTLRNRRNLIFQFCFRCVFCISSALSWSWLL